MEVELPDELLKVITFLIVLMFFLPLDRSLVFDPKNNRNNFFSLSPRTILALIVYRQMIDAPPHLHSCCCPSSIPSPTTNCPRLNLVAFERAAWDSSTEISIVEGTSISRSLISSFPQRTLKIAPPNASWEYSTFQLEIVFDLFTAL